MMSRQPFPRGVRRPSFQTWHGIRCKPYHVRHVLSSAMVPDTLKREAAPFGLLLLREVVHRGRAANENDLMLAGLVVNGCHDVLKMIIARQGRCVRRFNQDNIDAVNVKEGKDLG